MARTRRSAEGMRLAAASVILGVAILGAAGIRSGHGQEGDPEGKAREKVERGLEHLGGGQERKDDAAPDLLLVGGTIWTGDPQRPRVEAVAIRGQPIE